MSKKKKYQTFAVFFLIMAILLLIPNTDWSKNNSIFGFISLIVGTIGSIISIYIPTNYTLLIFNKSWSNVNEGEYQLIISSKKHGLGKASHVQTFERVGDSFEEVSVAIRHDMKGDVIIGTSLRFEGKVILTS